MKRKNTSEFIDDAKQVHGDRYSYELVEYKDRITKVKIICPDHGVFEQKPCNHLNKCGCPECGKNTLSQKMSLTTQLFITKAKQVHGDRYDYSLVEYKTAHTKVKIICPDHGVFEQRPSAHTSGNGCNKCNNGVVIDTLDFITKAKQVHSDRYDYLLVEYVNAHTKVKIVCPVHGVFDQRPFAHIRYKQGCMICARRERTDTINDFITKAKQVHGDRYDYSLVEYKTSHTKVKIICSVHGVFDQKVYAHTQGAGCPACAKTISNQEIEFVKYIRSLYKSKVVTNTRSVIPPYELDVYLPDLQVAFEYNGEYWHQEGVTKPIGYHQMKTDMCMDKGVKLHHIWEQDWTGNRDEVLTRVIDLLR